MNDSAQLEPVSELLRLPAWWRYALIAIATVILCSCSAPAVYHTAAFQEAEGPAADATNDQALPAPAP
jgi:hypothetical protein